MTANLSARALGYAVSMNAPFKHLTIAELRARDGDLCWLCRLPMRFDAKSNSGLAPTREHLVPRSLGGPNCEANLVLCHCICNRRLADLPLSEKIKRRDRQMRKLWRRNLPKPKKLEPATPVAMPTAKRLKGLDEFETPAFVGRMARVERRRKWAWYAMLAGAVAIGAGIGLVAF